MQIGDIKDKERARGWWNDQYSHPHETSHTIGEVMRWFRKNCVEYYETIPTSNLFDKSDIEITGVFRKKKAPNIFVRAYEQLKWIWTTHHEGGYWITFGKDKRGKS
jgi:hypothetical protein